MVKSVVTFDMDLFKLVMSMKEGLPFPLLRRELQRYIRAMTEEQKQDILNRREEIVNKWSEWKESNHYILVHVGFNDAEADMLDDKRLQSPGMRNVIKNRAIELGYLKPEVPLGL